MLRKTAVMNPSFEFRPALLRGAHRLVLEPDRIVLWKGNGRECMRFSEITAICWWESGTRSLKTRGLDLFDGPRRLRLSIARAPQADRSDTELAGFLDGAAGLLERAARREPGLEVTLSAGRGPRWAVFLTGVFAMAMATGLPLALWMTGPEGRLIPVLVAGALLALIGLPMVLTRPWAPARRVPAAQLAARLRAS